MATSRFYHEGNSLLHASTQRLSANSILLFWVMDSGKTEEAREGAISPRCRERQPRSECRDKRRTGSPN